MVVILKSLGTIGQGLGCGNAAGVEMGPHEAQQGQGVEVRMCESGSMTGRENCWLLLCTLVPTPPYKLLLVRRLSTMTKKLEKPYIPGIGHFC